MLKKPFFILRLLIALILFYACFEFWAQYRFSLNNIHLPTSIRSNMGLNSYEAMHLKPNKHLFSRSGIEYITNSYGFRTGTNKINTDKPFLILGGDSRIFGYNLPYKKTVSNNLEKSGLLNIYQQAYPGSSPALFNYGIFEKGLYQKLIVKPKFILYAYDRCDFYNDIVFAKELKTEIKGFSLRKLKLAMGGYAWGMCVRKFRVFLNHGKSVKKSSPKTIPSNPKKVPQKKVPQKTHKKPSFKITDIPFSKKPLNAMLKYSTKNNSTLILLYIPRAEELLIQNTLVRDRARTWAKQNKTIFLDAYKTFDNLIKGDLEKMRPYFLDLNEGIHYSAEGCSVISDLIMHNMRGNL